MKDKRAEKEMKRQAKLAKKAEKKGYLPAIIPQKAVGAVGAVLEAGKPVFEAVKPALVVAPVVTPMAVETPKNEPKMGGKTPQITPLKRGGETPPKTEKNQSVFVGFDTPQRAVTAGQWVVLYDGEVCLGGGEITEVNQ